MEASTSCSRARQLCAHAFKTVALAIYDYLGIVMSADVEKHPWAISTSGKRRRYDKDFKVFAQTGLVAESRARNMGQLARGTGHMPVSTGVGWRSKRLAEMLAQGWDAFKDCRELGIVFDGSRMGNPADGVYVFGVDHPAASFAVWGPPMASKMGWESNKQ